MQAIAVGLASQGATVVIGDVGDLTETSQLIFESATWDDLDFDLWRRIMAVNLNGPMLVCKAFLPLIRGRGWGRIINMASATVAVASPVSIAYRTSKMGVLGFTRALSATLGDDGITVNVVLPSLTALQCRKACQKRWSTTADLDVVLAALGSFSAFTLAARTGAMTAITLMISSPEKLAVLMGRMPSAASRPAGSRDRPQVGQRLGWS
jgi:NAD(P)-dependent dehydrogenase (short-subunit alcohol dehydrogenase family)